ncbi:hypothetical protein OC861_000790 [Tilletia horrida]|nr:hypothetical protein OC861_000790 [Tilletia horrida]
MALLIAPYNNAMRLGQGFNSYTHEICIDDAVLVSPQQAETVLTNDGNTMRLTALVQGKPSVWTKQDQVLLDVSQYDNAEAQLTAMEAEATSIPVTGSTDAGVSVQEHTQAPAAHADPASMTHPALASESGETATAETHAADGVVPDTAKAAEVAKTSKDAAVPSADAAKGAELNKVEPDQLKIKQAEVDAAIHRRKRDPAMLEAANKFKVNLSLDKMAEMHREFLLPKNKQAPGIGSQTQVFDIENSTGVSQTVVFQSRFVSKISEITSDMGVSASLSVKAGSCGGSGRGSFINTDKFASSDLNYYISVKVINQSINFKDALEFNPLDNIGPSDFNKVFGDSFISGFLEGGELNAIVSMKILNKAKATDIKAEGAIALGKDSLSVTAEGAFKTAKANLDLNTETTVQVSWLGGGNIKPPEEGWSVDSLARAATRFPDHVAQSPQRTYAILTKYETLRSYQVLKPPSVTPLDYKNATAYTNELLDVFMAYKAIYSRLTTQISDFQAGQLKFTIMKTEDETKRQEELTAALQGVFDVTPVETLSDIQKKARIGYFLASADGLDEARSAVRTQMSFIIERVDDITKDPSQVLSNPKEKFLPSYAFEELLPSLEPMFRNNKRTAPLTGEKMFSDSTDPAATDEGEVSRLCFVRKLTAEEASQEKLTNPDGNTVSLNSMERVAISKYLDARDDGIEQRLRLTPPLGSERHGRPPGKLFSALDFVQIDFLLQSIKITVIEGVISGIACRYMNGISWKRGVNDPKTPHRLDLTLDERITSVIVTVGTEAVINNPDSVLSLKVVTNAGRSLEALEPKVRRGGFKRKFIGNRAFYDVRSITFESPLEHGYLVGFWGWSAEQGSNQGLFRLGAVWGNYVAVDPKTLALEAEKLLKAKQDELAKEIRTSDADVLRSKLEDNIKDLALSNAKIDSLQKAAQDQDAKLAQKQAEIDAAERYKQQVKNQQWFNSIRAETFAILGYDDDGRGNDTGNGRALTNRIASKRLFVYTPDKGPQQTFGVEVCGNGFKIYNVENDSKKWYISCIVSSLNPSASTYPYGGIPLSGEANLQQWAYAGCDMVTDREAPGTTWTFIPIPNTDNHFKIALLDGPEDGCIRPDSLNRNLNYAGESGNGLYRTPSSGPFLNGARWRLAQNPSVGAGLYKILHDYADEDFEGLPVDKIDNGERMSLSIALSLYRYKKNLGTDIGKDPVVVWGGKELKDDNVLKRVQGLIASRGTLTIDGGLGEDPRPYVVKTATVIYRQDNRTKVRWAKDGYTINFNQ